MVYAGIIHHLSDMTLYRVPIQDQSFKRRLFAIRWRNCNAKEVLQQDTRDAAVCIQILLIYAKASAIVIKRVSDSVVVFNVTFVDTRFITMALAFAQFLPALSFPRVWQLECPIHKRV